jgi:proteasome lid subunit RPN8/RPN11
MLESCFRFEVVVADDAGSLVHRERVEDLQPVVEDMLFAGVRIGVIPNGGRLCSVSLTPVWAERGAPRVGVIAAELGALRKSYGLTAVAELVRAAVLTEASIVTALEREGARLQWWLEAQQREADPDQHTPRRLKVALRREPFPLTFAQFSEFGLVGPVTDANPVAIAIHGSVLEAIRAETAASLDRERADILVGHVVADPMRRVAVVVSDRIPAVRETTASREHFTFSPVTFDAARRAVAARRDGAVVVGWTHNHPAPCGRDCLRVVPPCQNSTLFLSAPADRAVHRACFSAPYMIALVSGKAAGRRVSEPEVRAWGWRDAAIVAREFSVI